MCLASTVIALWSLTQEAAGSNSFSDKYFSHWIQRVYRNLTQDPLTAHSWILIHRNKTIGIQLLTEVLLVFTWYTYVAKCSVHFTGSPVPLNVNKGLPEKCTSLLSSVLQKSKIFRVNVWIVKRTDHKNMFLTRMHSSMMRTDRVSGHLGGGCALHSLSQHPFTPPSHYLLHTPLHTHPLHPPSHRHTLSKCMQGYTPSGQTNMCKNITFASRSVIKLGLSFVFFFFFFKNFNHFINVELFGANDLKFFLIKSDILTTQHTGIFNDVIARELQLQFSLMPPSEGILTVIQEAVWVKLVVAPSHGYRKFIG